MKYIKIDINEMCSYLHFFMSNDTVVYWVLGKKCIRFDWVRYDKFYYVDKFDSKDKAFEYIKQFDDNGRNYYEATDFDGSYEEVPDSLFIIEQKDKNDNIVLITYDADYGGRDSVIIMNESNMLCDRWERAGTMQNCTQSDGYTHMNVKERLFAMSIDLNDKYDCIVLKKKELGIDSETEIKNAF